MTAPCEIVPLTEIQQRLQMGKNQVYAGIKAGQILGHKIGGKFVVPRAWFENWTQGIPTTTRPRLPSAITSPFLRRVDPDTL